VGGNRCQCVVPYLRTTATLALSQYTSLFQQVPRALTALLQTTVYPPLNDATTRKASPVKRLADAVDCLHCVKHGLMPE
jgi:hypothetical protein